MIPIADPITDSSEGIGVLFSIDSRYVSVVNLHNGRRRYYGSYISLLSITDVMSKGRRIVRAHKNVGSRSSK